MPGDVNKGVVLIAAGSPYYGGWAFNLAMGITKCFPEIKITLLHSGNALQYIQYYKSIFDKMIEIPNECIMSNGIQSYLRAKVCLYDLTPYDETIFIDADVMWSPTKSINNLFDELKEVEITFGNRGQCELNTDPRLIWSDLKSMKNKFGDAIVYNLSSEFIYFKKSKENKDFFEVAKKCFDNPEVEYNRFAGTVPDELAFQIAMIKTGVKPHKLPFLPFYWEPYEKRNLTQPELLKSEYYGYSVGGCTVTPSQQLIYDDLGKVYAKMFGLKYPFLSKSKRELFPNRKNI